MEAFSQRESILLGYSPQRFIGSPSSASKAPLRDSESDVDFHDVFGGPPRRYSTQEVRRSDESTDSSAYQGEEDPVLPRRPWSGLSEKPVFGEETANRGRYQGDDFFDDIFRGEESCNSPRRSDRDPLRSTPGSRVLSPARPLPPKADPFGSSPLAPFSLPAKLNKAIDLPAFGSGNRSPSNRNGTSNAISLSYGSITSISRFSSQSIQGEDELRNDSRRSFHQNLLSHEFSRSSKEFTYMTNHNEMEIGGNLKKNDAKGGEPPSNSNQFHFSIYKWASKGVPLLMPLRGGHSLKSRDKIKTERCSSSNGRVESNSNVSQLWTSDSSDIITLLNQHTSSNAESSTLEGKKLGKGSFFYRSTQNKVESCQIVDEAPFAIPESKPHENSQKSVGNIPDGIIVRDKGEVTKPYSLLVIGLPAKVEKETPTVTQEAQKSLLRPSRSLSKHKNEDRVLQEKVGQEIPMVAHEAQKSEFRPSRPLVIDTNDEKVNDEISRENEERGRVAIAKVLQPNGDLTENVKKQDSKKIVSGVVADKARIQSPTVNSGSNLGRNRVKGKVTEFVKIFNEEASSKPKTNVDTGSKSSRSKSKGTYGSYNETTRTSPSTKGIDVKLDMPDVKDVRTLPDASAKVEKDHEKLEKQQPFTKSTIHQRSDNSSGQRGVSVSGSEPLPVHSKDTRGSMDDHFDFLIQKLSVDQKDKLPESGEDYCDIQVLDVKIRKWSKGKEGNIRSLLSTLQYVLWPESGWKPVPLVDIIEGSAVKRAYQKALLCLHPDKLQQKGAASHQKYTAEKVFDILQEAWDHFNSLGSL